MNKTHPRDGKLRNTDKNSIDESFKVNFKKFLHEWVFFQMNSAREEGLAVPQLFTLRYLYYNKPKNLSAIANFMGVSKPTVTGLINTLEKNGFVIRKHGADDRRRVDITITQKGLDLSSKLESRSVFVIEEFLNCIPDDVLMKFNESMVNVTENLGKIVDGNKIQRKREKI